MIERLVLECIRMFFVWLKRCDSMTVCPCGYSQLRCVLPGCREHTRAGQCFRKRFERSYLLHRTAGVPDAAHVHDDKPNRRHTHKNFALMSLVLFFPFTSICNLDAWNHINEQHTHLSLSHTHSNVLGFWNEKELNCLSLFGVINVTFLSTIIQNMSSLHTNDCRM